jgi:hypothetical protein
MRVMPSRRSVRRSYAAPPHPTNSMIVADYFQISL